MTKRQTNRSRAIRRAAVVLAAAVGVSTVASTAGNAATSAGTPSKGGKITVGIFNQLPGWCVNDNPANSGLMVGRTVFETLFEKNKQGKLVGLLADKARPSNGNKTWNITLRKGISFHDGTPFNADAVKTNLDVLNGIGPYKQHFEPGFVAAKQAGKSDTDAFLAGATAAIGKAGFLIGTAVSFSANVVGVTKVNDYEVKVDLHRAQADLPGTLFASGRFVMRSPKAFASKAVCQAGVDASGKSFGTGPFMFKSWDKNKAVVVKNPTYWRKAKNGDKLPYLDQITFSYVVESAQRANATKSGKFAASMFTAESESTQIQDLRKDKKFVEYKTPNEFYPAIFLNHQSKDSPFSNKNARLALTTCIDRAGYAKVRTRGEASPAKSIVGSTSIMYNTKGFSAFNVNKAKEYVAAFKAETGKTTLEFTFPVTESTNTKKNAKFLIDQWKRCGLTPKQVDTTVAQFLLDIFTQNANLTTQNKYDAVGITLLEGTDASFNLPFLLTNSFPTASSSVGASTHPGANLYRGAVGQILGLSYHTNAAIDKALFDAQASGNSAAYKAATKLIQEEAIVAPTVQFYYTMFTSTKLGGVGTTPLASKSIQRVMANYGIDWSGVYLNK